MNYKRIHDDIIERAKIRNWNKKNAPCYVERHHILPKSLGGCPKWTGDNVVCLTAKEHFLVHLLLIKITHGKDKTSMIRALMYFQGKVGNRNIKIKNSKMYENLRKEFALAQSEIGKRRKGKLSEETKKLIGKSSLGRNVGRKHSKEAIEKIRTSSTGRFYSEETREKIREARKKDWENRKKNNWRPTEESNRKRSVSVANSWKERKLKKGLEK